MSKLNNYQKIREFHEYSGLVLEDKIPEKLFENLKLINLRVGLIDEEAKELEHALEAAKDKDQIEIENPFKEVIDALADIQYVTYGAGASFGINLNDALIEYLELNDLYEEGLNGDTCFEIIRTRFSSYMSRVHGMIINDKIDYDLIESGQTVDLFVAIKNAITNFKKVVKEQRASDLKEALVEILFHTYSASAAWGINCDEAYAIVHNSNMTKFCMSEEEAKATVKKYKEQYEQIKIDNKYPEEPELISGWLNEMKKKGINIYDSPNYRLSNDKTRYIVFNESNGKILKSINYIPADFTKMMEDSDDD